MEFNKTLSGDANAWKGTKIDFETFWGLILIKDVRCSKITILAIILLMIKVFFFFAKVSEKCYFL